MKQQLCVGKISRLVVILLLMTFIINTELNTQNANAIGTIIIGGTTIGTYPSTAIDTANELGIEVSIKPGGGYWTLGVDFITIKAISNGHYIRNVEYEKVGSKSYANGYPNYIGRALSENFQLVILNKNPLLIALKSLENNKFLCAEEAGKKPLDANRTQITKWGVFEVIKNDDGTISLKSKANGKYVCAESKETPLIANKTEIGPSEKFKITYHTSSQKSAVKIKIDGRLEIDIQGRILLKRKEGTYQLIGNTQNSKDLSGMLVNVNGSRVIKYQANKYPVINVVSCHPILFK